MNELSIVLFNPEIPQNTGNIIRLTANIGATLYLVEPLGFDLDSKKLKRAHLYYDEFANIVIFKDWESCKNHFHGSRMIGIETGGSNNVFNKNFLFNDVFVFGFEIVRANAGFGGITQSYIDLYNATLSGVKDPPSWVEYSLGEVIQINNLLPKNIQQRDF